MTEKTQPKLKTPLVVDTNIIINCLSEREDLNIKMRGFLFGFIPEYLLCISEISHFECLKVLNPKRASDFREFLAIFFTYPLDRPKTTLAADLHNFYRLHEDTKACVSSIDSEDILISATGVLSGGYILTQNYHDFPPTFFNCVYKHRLIYKDRNVEKMLIVYLLQPDMEAITHQVNSRYNLQAQTSLGK